ncbi:small hydrophobic protein [Streptomyces carminius]|uniref:Small hydrophobic protein n=1 Tax=Streptomyces carminius TaxID=2665496 RepID=A0A2M8LR09_9ACTN|nr:small hydrophobic protein [Streptomyces carminius]PJE94379.1 small hydrophobic protein [Streptomyces carminius]
MTGTRYFEGKKRGGADLSGDERSTFGIIGLVCAVAGFFVMGFVLGPIAMICGWLAMGRRWIGARSKPAMVAIVLGAIDTVLALVWLATAPASWGLWP